MSLHNARLDHAYGGDTSARRVIEDLAFNVDLLAEILEFEHYIRDFTGSQLLPTFPASARVAATAATTINSTTATAITGATTTFTPPFECYAEVRMTFDAESNSTALFIGELYVDGVAQTGQALMLAAAGTRLTISQTTALVPLTAASHTLELRGRLNAAVGSYNVRNVHTGFVYRLVPVAYASEIASRQQALVLPDAVNSELTITFPRPLGWYGGRVQAEVLYGGSVSSANAWRVDLLGNAIGLNDTYTAMADVSGSVDVPGIGTANRAKWYSLSTLTLPVDRSHTMISFRFRRAGGHANDTYAGDVYVHTLRCRYLPGRHEI